MCKTRYSHLWYKCLTCNTELLPESKTLSFIKGKGYDKFFAPGFFQEQLLEQANTIIAFTNLDGELLMCNQAIEDFTGYTRLELFKEGWLNLLYRGQEPRRQIFEAVMKGALSSLRSKTYEGAVIKNDGTECMLSWRLAAIRDKTDRILGLLCVAQDITERKVTEKDINVHGQRLKDILLSVGDYALIATNLEGKITYYGLGAEEVLGWKLQEVYLKDISMIFPERHVSRITGDLYSKIKKEKRFEEELTLAKRGKTQFPAILTASPLLDKDKNIVGYTYMIRDITERKRMEGQIIRSERLAAIGQIAAGVAHEINNPLLVLLGRVDLLEMSKEKSMEEISKTLEIIKSQGQKMQTIIDRLLSYSRKRRFNLEELDLHETIQSIYPLLGYHPEFKNIIWKEKFRSGLPKVLGDFNQLQEVFLNIALNACQVMEGGGTITIETGYSEDGFIRVSVTDTGAGIKQEDLNRIFEPFFTTKNKGTGLGLAICNNIVQDHGGRIETKSRFGEGAMFTVILPAKK